MNRLAVNYNSKKRKVVREDKCCFCKVVETIEHSLLHCEWTSYIWFGALDLRIDKRGTRRLDVWWENMLAVSNKKGQELREKVTYPLLCLVIKK